MKPLSRLSIAAIFPVVVGCATVEGTGHSIGLPAHPVGLPKPVPEVSHHRSDEDEASRYDANTISGYAVAGPVEPTCMKADFTMTLNFLADTATLEQGKPYPAANDAACTNIDMYKYPENYEFRMDGYNCVASERVTEEEIAAAKGKNVTFNKVLTHVDATLCALYAPRPGED